MIYYVLFVKSKIKNFIILNVDMNKHVVINHVL